MAFVHEHRTKDVLDTTHLSRPPLPEPDCFDLRPAFPLWFSRFLGYRPPGPNSPIWALGWLVKIPVIVEEYIAAFVSSFLAIVLICLVNSYSDLSHLAVPLSLGSAGASAVILYATPLTPAASPRSLILGHFLAALVSTIFTRIFHGHLQATPNVTQGEMSRNVSWLAGALSLAFTILLQSATNSVHPPGGATALLGAISPGFVSIGWRFIAFTLVMCSLLLAVALVFGNLGRRRYPLYWFFPPRPQSKSKTPAQIIRETIQELEQKSGPTSEHDLIVLRQALYQLT